MYTGEPVLAVRMRSDSNVAILHITIAVVLAISVNHCTRYNYFIRLADFFFSHSLVCSVLPKSQALMWPNEQTKPSGVGYPVCKGLQAI